MTFIFCNISIEFLRFLYYDEVEFNDNLAFKLLAFADKYVQNGLSYKCTDFLKHHMSRENVYTIWLPRKY